MSPELAAIRVEPAGCPPHVRGVGAVALLMGVSLPILALLAARGASGGSALDWAFASLAGLGGVLLMLGGSAFLLRARWGRIALWLFAWGAWPAGVGLTLAAAQQVADHGAPMERFILIAGVSLGAALFALVLAVSLLFGAIPSWCDRTSPPRGEGPSTLSTLALASMILALVPPWGLGHAVSLPLGILALGRIRSARGGLRGRGLALTGIFVSAGVFALLAGGVGAAAVYVAGSGSADANAARQRLRELALLQRLHQELDWDHDGHDDPCTTTLTALLDALPKDSLAGPLEAAQVQALRAADYGVLGERAAPSAGYVYRLETGAAGDEFDSRWTISACPWRGGRQPILQVDEHGEPWELGGDRSAWRK